MLECLADPESDQEIARACSKARWQLLPIELRIDFASSLSTNLAEEQPRCSPAPLFPVLGFPEPQIHANLGVKIAVHLGIKRMLQALHLKPRSAPDVQVR